MESFRDRQKRLLLSRYTHFRPSVAPFLCARCVESLRQFAAQISVQPCRHSLSLLHFGSSLKRHERHSPHDVDRLHVLVAQRPRRNFPPGLGNAIPLPFRYSRDQFEFNLPAVIQTPSAEFEHCRRGTRLYRLDQPGNPRGDTTEEPALFDAQFIQVPNGCQMPVHLYSMPNVELAGKLSHSNQRATGCVSLHYVSTLRVQGRGSVSSSSAPMT